MDKVLANATYLKKLGWSDVARPKVYRVLSEQRGFYRLSQSEGVEHWAEVPGRFRHRIASRSDYPCVGDWVSADFSGDRLIIDEILPRKTLLVRKAAGESEEEQLLAANVDYAFICASLGAPINIRKLERYLALCWDGKVEPILLFTKKDLCPNVAETLSRVDSLLHSTRYFCLSPKNGEGLAAFEALLTLGTTSVFLGPSGVGKSTLINQCLKLDRQKINEVREEDHKGRHTTTARSLFVTDAGACVIDTPGMRELQLMDHVQGVTETFTDIDALALKCKFTNCRHENEPNCAVKAAIADGTLTQERFYAYLKLLGEISRRPVKKNKTELKAKKTVEKKTTKALDLWLKKKRGR